MTARAIWSPTNCTLNFNTAGGSDVAAASFTLHGMPADLFCMYASWKTKDGRTWQMTVSAYSYDLPTVRFVVGRMLEDIVFGLPAA